jgi:hypothetical protein
LHPLQRQGPHGASEGVAADVHHVRRRPAPGTRAYSVRRQRGGKNLLVKKKLLRRNYLQISANSSTPNYKFAGRKEGTGREPREGPPGRAPPPQPDVHPGEHPAWPSRLRHHHQAPRGRDHPALQEVGVPPLIKGGTIRIQEA